MIHTHTKINVCAIFAENGLPRFSGCCWRPKRVLKLFVERFNSFATLILFEGSDKIDFRCSPNIIIQFKFVFVLNGWII